MLSRLVSSESFFVLSLFIPKSLISLSSSSLKLQRALSFGACLGGNGTLLGASANIVTAGISTSRGFGITFLNFLYPGMIVMVATVAIANLYMLIVYVWI